MEIDITRFFREADAFEFSASAAERGQNVARETWLNAKREAANNPLLTTEEQLDALRDDVRGYGAWSCEEIDGWSTTECNALFVQLVSGAMRELEKLCMRDDGEIDWRRAEHLSSEGRIAGVLYRGDDGRVYYYLGT
jgi:hypothetical protein